MKKSLGRVLSAIFICTLLFAIFAAFASVSYAKNKNDYSRPGYSDAIYNETFDAVEFLRDKLKVSVGAAENKYLTEFSEFKLSYPKNIPASYISLDTTQGGREIFVTALPYSYTNSEGVSISWLPTKVTFGATAKEFNHINGKYEAKFDVLNPRPGLAFSVEYTATISIPKDDVNCELSRAYRDARYFDYLEKQLEYESALEIYSEYLSDKKIYDELYLEYTEYLNDLSEYEAALAKYEAYLLALEKYERDYVLYLESLKTAEELADEIRAYEEYVSKMEKINHRLSLVEDMKTQKTSLKRSLYSAILGDAVDQVLAEQDLLTGNVVGADKAIVEGAGDATREIREFFDGYFSRSTDSAKYLYYQVNYQKLRNNVVKLFQCLDNLYANEQIKGIIAAKERSEKFEILLAQLYLAAKAISDDPLLSYYGAPYEGYYAINTLSGFKTPGQILGDVSDYFEDKNIATPPADEAYPDRVYKPNYTPVAEPKKPEKVTRPTQPSTVIEPTLPTPVAEPIAPERVENVNGVSQKAPFAEGSIEAELVAAYRQGLLSLRTERYLSKDFSMTVNIPVSKVYGADKVTVTCHDRNGIPQTDVTVESGTFAEIEYVPETYTSPDGKYSYHFETWVDDTGKVVNLSSVTRDMRVYPKFREEINKFTVTWKNGEETVEEKLLEYGSLPSCNVIPKKEGDLNKYYTFMGWSPEAEPLTQNVTYTAVFEEHYTVPGLSDGNIYKTEGSDSEITVVCGSLLGTRIDVSRLIEISAGKYSIKFVFSMPALSRGSGVDNSAEFTVSYADVLSMKKNAVAGLEFSISHIADADEVLVKAYGNDGEEQSFVYKISAAVPSEKNHEDMRVVYYSNEEKLYAKSEYSNGKIRFNLNTGCYYSYVLEIFPSLITVLPQEVRVSVDKSEALPGETVSVEVNLPLGVELISVYYVDSAGVRVTVTGGKFEMPPFDVSVGAETKKIVYTVNFISDGMVISTKKYHYGDTVEIPVGLEKASDGKYSYKFLRWTPAIDVVTKNVDYTAVYERTAIIREENSGLKISEGTLRILIVAGITAVVFLLGILPNAVVAIVLIVRRRRRGIAILGKRKKLKRIE